MNTGNIPKFMQPGLFKKKKRKATPPAIKPKRRQPK